MKSKPPVFIPASDAIKQMVGEGGLPPHILKKCQDFLESSPIDFAPYASRYLENLKEIRNQILQGGTDPKDSITEIGNTVMQLKSNGSMFHYQLISMISDVMLRFLDHTKDTNQDFIDILDIYLRVLEIIVNKKLTGNGRQDGFILTQELQFACHRYFTKYNIKV